MGCNHFADTTDMFPPPHLTCILLLISHVTAQSVPRHGGKKKPRWAKQKPHGSRGKKKQPLGEAQQGLSIASHGGCPPPKRNQLAIIIVLGHVSNTLATH